MAVEFLNGLIAYLARNGDMEQISEEHLKMIYNLLLERLRIQSVHESTNPLVLLEFVRDIRRYHLQGMATEMQTEAMKKLMTHMQDVTRQPNVLRDNRQYFQDVMDEFRFQLDNQSFQPLLADYHEVEARNHFHTGDMDQFVVSMLRSQLVAHRHGQERPHEDSRRLLEVVLSQIQKKLFDRLESSSNPEDREHFRSLIDYFYRDLGGLLSGLGSLSQVVTQLNGELSPSASSDKPPTLKKATFFKVLSTENQLLHLVQSFLQTTTMREILAQVGNDLAREEGIKSSKREEGADGKNDEGEMGGGKEGCGRRRKRQIAGGMCLDSRSEVEEEDARLAEDLYKRLMVTPEVGRQSEALVKMVDFYESLQVTTESLSGTTINVEEVENLRQAYGALTEKQRLSLDTNIDFLAKSLIGQDFETLKSLLDPKTGKSGISNLSEKIKSSAERAGLAFTVFLVGKHLANGDMEGLGFDALNLYALPKMGEVLTVKLTAAAERMDSEALRISAPVLGRALGNFGAFLGLYSSIKARQSGGDKEMADLNIATNSVFIVADVPALAAEAAAVAGIDLGTGALATAAELAGPVGAAVSVAVIVASQLIEAGLRVRRTAKLIRMTEKEKTRLYWRYLFGKDMGEQLKEDIDMERLLDKYLNGILEKLGKDFDRAFISIPEIVRNYNLVRYGGRDFLRRIVCRDLRSKQSTEFATSPEAMIADLGGLQLENFSRLFPTHLGEGRLKLECGPVGEGADVKVSKVERTPVAQNPPEECQYGSARSTEVLLERQRETLFLGNSPPHCKGTLAYKSNAVDPATSLYYLNTDVAVVTATSPNATVVFIGSKVLELGQNGSGGPNTNRIHLSSKTPIDKCVILTRGHNVIYPSEAVGESFNCIFHKKDWRQRNMVSLRNGTHTFTDVRGVDAIMGSPAKETLLVSHAKNVDGGGGGDTVRLFSKSAVVSANPGDRITGVAGGTVRLPFSLGDIDVVSHKDGLCGFGSAAWPAIPVLGGGGSAAYEPYGEVLVAQELQVLTSDGYFVTPTRVRGDGKVTSLQVSKYSRESDISSLKEKIDKLVALKGPKFLSLTKQLLTRTTHVTISEKGKHLFQADKGHDVFYWYGDAGNRHVYIPKARSKVTISKMNGLLHLEGVLEENSKVTFEMAEDKTVQLKVASSGLKVTLQDGIVMAKLAMSEDVIYDLVPDPNAGQHHVGKTSVFSSSFGGDVYQGIGFRLVRDFCSHHRVVVKGAMSEPAQELEKASVACLEFPSATSVQFLRHHEDLLILSSRSRLLLQGFYDGRGHGTLSLALKLEGRTMKPEEFTKRTSGSVEAFRHYKVDTVLTVYHNQPADLGSIGMLDLTPASTHDLNVYLDQHGDLNAVANSTSRRALIKNWKSFEGARRMIFITQNEIITRCMIGCEPHEILREFRNGGIEDKLKVIKHGSDEKRLKGRRKKRQANETAMNFKMDSPVMSGPLASSTVDQIGHQQNHHKDEGHSNSRHNSNSSNMLDQLFSHQMVNGTLLLANHALAAISTEFRKRMLRTSAADPNESELGQLEHRVKKSISKGQEQWDQ